MKRQKLIIFLLVFVFLLSAMSACQKEESKTNFKEHWEGSYYGFWLFDRETMTGVFEDLDANWYDCCALIKFNANDTADLTIWDEDMPFSDPISEVKLKFEENPESESGTAVSVDGYFFDDIIEEGQWRLNFELINDIKQLLFDDHHSSKDLEMDYQVLLRPWGVRWTDYEEQHPEDLPYYYDDWYLPLLEKGVKEAPKNIGEVEEEIKTDISKTNFKAHWEGSYYGFWLFDQDTVKGVFEDLSANWYDCCALIKFNADDTADLTIWDEDMPFSDPISEVKLRFEDNPADEFGTAVSVDGYFFDDIIEEGQWRLNFELINDIKQLLFNDHHSSKDLEMDYEVLLRPWGVRWTDYEEQYPEELPYYYDDWYLPLLEKGVKEAPEAIGEE